jgi:hypothetical protein
MRLTQLALVFLPLTFVARVFGMNINPFNDGASVSQFAIHGRRRSWNCVRYWAMDRAETREIDTAERDPDRSLYTSDRLPLAADNSSRNFEADFPPLVASYTVFVHEILVDDPQVGRLVRRETRIIMGKVGRSGVATRWRIETFH